MQCCWSMTFLCGFGSASWIRILLFSSLTFKMPTKNYFLFFIFSDNYFLKVHIHHFSKIKSQKVSQNSRNQGFSYYFCNECMMIEGSGSGSIPLTNGSGSRKPRNKWILWIRIRIRNTGRKVRTITHFLKILLNCEKLAVTRLPYSLVPVPVVKYREGNDEELIPLVMMRFVSLLIPFIFICSFIFDLQTWIRLLPGGRWSRFTDPVHTQLRHNHQVCFPIQCSAPLYSFWVGISIRVQRFWCFLRKWKGFTGL